MDRIDPPELPAENPAIDDPPDKSTGERPEQKSSIGDYVRDLQREYDEQQEEGKIDLADTD